MPGPDGAVPERGGRARQQPSPLTGSFTGEPDQRLTPMARVIGLGDEVDAVAVATDHLRNATRLVHDDD